MSKIFLADGPEKSTRLKRVICKNETVELQDRLHKNWELLAGDQMTPEAPRRWLLIGREMPVHSPSTGQKSFSLDFLFSDQDGMPTFVEAKRCNDPRARREVIGQMLEYVANGRAYWSKEDIKDALVQTCGTLEKAATELRNFREQGEQDLDAFLKLFVENLQSGKVRLVFFLEDSSYELRTLAEFLNHQLKSAEVFVVEARQYLLADGGPTIIAPHVVGFTEVSRVEKALVREQEQKIQVERGEAAFWKRVDEQLPEQAGAVRDFVHQLQSMLFAKVTWSVSAIVLVPKVLKGRGLFGIRRPATLEVYLYYWDRKHYPELSSRQIAFRDHFVAELQQLGLLQAEHSHAYPTIKPEVWIPKRQLLLEIVTGIVEAYEREGAKVHQEIYDETESSLEQF